MKTSNFNKQLVIALVAALFGVILLGSARAARVVRVVVVVPPPPTDKPVVSR